MQERLKGTMKRYGHLGSCAMMIEATKVEVVEGVPKETPW